MLDMIAPAALAACGLVLPGPAECGVEFRHAEVHCSLTPAVVKPGGEATLTVQLTPRAGATWHGARLVPARVEILPATGWSAEASELALPPPETPTAPREFTVHLRAGEEWGGRDGGDPAAGRGVLELRMRYGVRLPDPSSPAKGPPEEAGADGRTLRPGPVPAGATFRVALEEAVLAVDMPAALPAAEVPAPGVRPGGEAGATAGGAEGPVGKPEGGPGDPEAQPEAHPALPAIFSALAAAVVFAGLALWIRARR